MYMKTIPWIRGTKVGQFIVLTLKLNVLAFSFKPTLVKGCIKDHTLAGKENVRVL